MGIELEIDGMIFRVDTLEEAAALARQLRPKPSEPNPEVADDKKILPEEPGTNFRFTPESFSLLLERLGEQQTKALEIIVLNGAVLDKDFRSQLGVDSNQGLAGVLAGISKHATALGIPTSALFTVRHLRSEGRRDNTYTVANPLLFYAAESNWPKPMFRKYN